MKIYFLIPGSLSAKRNCWNMFKIISGVAACGAESGSGSWCGLQIGGKVVLNIFRRHVCAASGVASMKTLD